ncbi:MAG: PhzF family phenazine biosynthesis protein [Rhodobiaceae bacterium]|nr:PhzF family phenazine biosynthesis protein [Rhodobiaceae bacterium]
MPKAPHYILDNFTSTIFAGNPASVCLLDRFPKDAVMRKIAMENGYSQTAFVRSKNGFNPEVDEIYTLRWFTPTTEVDLCGHATMAASYVLFNEIGVQGNHLRFDTKSGILDVQQTDSGSLTLEFPAREVVPVDLRASVEPCLGEAVLSTAASGPTLIAELANEVSVAQLSPNIDKIAQTLDYDGLIVTARGDKHDFVSRFFCPRLGITEDPVTGSAHCGLAPFWAAKLGKTQFEARQVSKRGGELAVRLEKNKVYLTGEAKLYLRGEIFYED